MYTSLLFINCLIILISSVLLYYQKHQIRNVLFLSLFLITLSFLSIVRTVIFFDESNWLVAVLFNTFSPLYYLIGPFLYLYIRDFLTQNQKLKKIHLLGLLGKFLRNLKVGFKLSPTFFFSLLFG
jgi:hypothetical protein